MARHGDKVVKILRQKAASHEPVDIQDIFERFTMDAGGEFLFGDPELNTLDRPLRRPRSQLAASTKDENDYGTFVNAYNIFNVVAVNRFYNLPIVWATKYLFNDPLAGPAASVASYFEPLAKKAFEMKQTRPLNQDKEGEKISFIQHLAASTDGEPSVDPTNEKTEAELTYVP